MGKFVLVSGLPATGKTTLATALASELRVPHIDKDAFLERLFSERGPSTAEQRRSLSRAADLEFQQAALSQSFAVLSSWWRHPASAQDSGTPLHWLSHSAIFEVHCSCPPQLAARRFLHRVRHPSHHDDDWNENTWLAFFAAPHIVTPLFPRAHVVCNTETPVDYSEVAAVANAIRHHFR